MTQKARRGSNFQHLHGRFGKGRRNREENVIPMINVIFLLLLYFMVTGSLAPDYDIVPPLSAQISEPPTHIPTISVTHDGKLWFESRPVNLDELKTALSGTTGYKKIKIHADANVDALTVSMIMNVLADNGIFRFVLVTKNRSDAS